MNWNYYSSYLALSNFFTYQVTVSRIACCIGRLCSRVNCSDHDLNFNQLLVVKAVSHMDFLRRPAKAQCSFMVTSCAFIFDIVNFV